MLIEESYEITINDKEYPSIIKDRLGRYSPKKLYLRGNLDLLNKSSLGFIGARDYHHNSYMLAKNMVNAVSSTNVIVSGYARGIDVICHYTALATGGSTICVLPQGFSEFYIRKPLRDVWDWGRVLVISQFSEDTSWTISNAMQRNSLVISLSNQMVLIEAGAYGGSINAGYKTLALGVPLTVITSRSLPPFRRNEYTASYILIEKGAIAYNVELTKHRTVVSDDLFCGLKSPITYTGSISMLGYNDVQ